LVDISFFRKKKGHHAVPFFLMLSYALFKVKMNDTDDIKIQPEIRPDEKLLWTGHPARKVMLQASDARHIPFSIAWCGFAILWEVAVLSAESPFNIFAVFGVPFVLAGLYMVFGRFFVDAHRRRNTYYGLTDKRVIIVSENINRSVKSIDLNVLNEYSLKEKKDGSGTIMFGDASSNYPYRMATPDPLSFYRIVTALEGILDVRSVYNLISQSKKPDAL